MMFNDETAVPLPQELFAPGMTVWEIGVWARMVLESTNYYNAQSVRKIAQGCGISITKATQVLESLEAKGFLSIYKDSTRGNSYLLTIPG